MGYLREFQKLLDEQNLSRFMHLWEEYCLADTVEGPELLQVLKMIQDSQVASFFGEYVETVLPLWKQIPEESVADSVLRIVLDLENKNSPLLADLSTEFLKNRYGQSRDFNEKLRIVGLRSRHSFQGAIRNFELLNHLEKGKFVFHTGGWGVGEVMEVSLLREHVLIEFEGIATPKDVSFDNAFKNLVALSDDHFLARRFGNPDDLEREAKEDPIAVIHLLLQDLGPKTAVEIKDELCDLVIPEKEWSKWWQGTRTRLKKDSKIKSPDGTKEPFELRNEAISSETRLKEALLEVKGKSDLIGTIYNYARDFPDTLKQPEIKQQLKQYLEGAFKNSEKPQELFLAHQIEISFLLEEIASHEYKGKTQELLRDLANVDTVLNAMEIIALKKRALVALREIRSDWQQLFFHLLFVITPNALRDYIFKELLAQKELEGLIKQKLTDLIHKVSLYPEAFFWYFQKIAEEDEVPCSDIDSKRQFLEAFLILLHYVEHDPEYRDLTKKMYQIFIAKRYAVVRTIIQGASVEYLNEILLLATKCHTLTKHDQKILHSLAEVAEPAMGKKKESHEHVAETIWTTAEGYRKIQERLHHIGTVETVDNAREIEAARALGDLRENSEYKFALERRARLQAELKMLSTQVNHARILTKEDIALDTVGVGTIVEVTDSKGKKTTYTLLGPWDADPEQNVLSFQSKLAQAMIGHKKGEHFQFQGEKYIVSKINSYLK